MASRPPPRPRGSHSTPKSKYPQSRLRTPNLSSFQLIDSPSRTTGLLPKGELSLLDPKIQEEYRAFIQTKIDNYVREFPIEVPFDTWPARAKEMGASILLLFRKLREGVVATARHDDFAIEVYESSACWSIIFRDSAQSTSVLAQLPDLYNKASKADPIGSSRKQASPRQGIMILVQHLHLLRSQHPSQSDFHSSIRKYITNPDVLLPEYRAALLDIATYTRRNNYAALYRLSDPQTNTVLCQAAYQEHPNDPIYGMAILTLLEQLRDLAREGAWKAIHSSYRELAIHSEDAASWLRRTLLISDKPSTGVISKDPLRQWVASKCKDGDLVPKEGTEDRWFISKTPKSAG